MNKIRRLLVVACVAALMGGTLAASAQTSTPDPRRIASAIAAQERNTAKVMSIPGVVGTAVGVTETSPVVLVLTEEPGVVGIPQRLDGFAVEVIATGKIQALNHKPGHTTGKPGGGTSIDPTTRFTRPVPIGVSTGNEGECSAGTIGARVKDPSNPYALSNNHVYALENEAPIGSRVLQPGLYDSGCAFDANNVLGTLSNFVPIVFSTSAANTVDAAIAASSTADLGNATPANGYGIPTSNTTAATVGASVQKYGRTSSLTSGEITAINATINVGYRSGTARFVGQIIVQSRKPFIKSGDSGSLLVNSTRNPIGLLFAGSGDGKLAVANQIDLVLAAFGVTVDGE